MSGPRYSAAKSLPNSQRRRPWLRWEAALEEMTAYHAVPAAFRVEAVKELGRGIEDLIMLSPSKAVPRPTQTPTAEDQKFCEATIFPFTVRGRSASPRSSFLLAEAGTEFVES
jgi:hypothetical protein